MGERDTGGRIDPLAGHVRTAMTQTVVHPARYGVQVGRVSDSKADTDGRGIKALRAAILRAFREEHAEAADTAEAVPAQAGL